MTARTLNLDDSLYQYLLDVSLRETPLLKRLRDETQALPMARWAHIATHGFFADPDLPSVLRPYPKLFARSGRDRRSPRRDDRGAGLSL